MDIHELTSITSLSRNIFIQITLATSANVQTLRPNFFQNYSVKTFFSKSFLHTTFSIFMKYFLQPTTILHTNCRVRNDISDNVQTLRPNFFSKLFRENFFSKSFFYTTFSIFMKYFLPPTTIFHTNCRVVIRK